jgi:hypothetical protein
MSGLTPWERVMLREGLGTSGFCLAASRPRRNGALGSKRAFLGRQDIVAGEPRESEATTGPRPGGRSVAIAEYAE